MAKLSPSILSADFYKLGEEVEEAISFGADWLHIDVMDGKFVPPITFGSKIVKDIKKHKKDYFCDVHLMVNNPMPIVENFINVDADLINIQYEAMLHGDRIISLIHNAGKLAGVTINPSTPISVLECYLPIVDLILVMSVNPGYSGQKAITYTFDKIKELKTLRDKNNYNYLIEIDGGISLNNVKDVLSLGADVVVAGSGYFGSSIDEKKRLINMVHIG